MTKTIFAIKGERASDFLGLIHIDVCSRMSIYDRGNFSYFTVIDHHSRYGYVYRMRYKSETFEKLKIFRIEVEKQLGKSIKILRLN